MLAIYCNSFINKRSLLSCYLRNQAMRKLIYCSILLINDTCWLAMQELSNKQLDILQCFINAVTPAGLLFKDPNNGPGNVLC